MTRTSRTASRPRSAARTPGASRRRWRIAPAATAAGTAMSVSDLGDAPAPVHARQSERDGVAALAVTHERDQPGARGADGVALHQHEMRMAAALGGRDARTVMRE